MPQNTDLVTDLPADFEVFGQAVATSMADLLGGTSGQILAKNSNTDMDFVWVANDVGDITAVTAGTGISGGGTSGAVTITNSMATEITAKGDLIVGTGSATFDNLAAGANGSTILADSAATTGLRYQSVIAAGKNTLINSDFGIWQRGTAAFTIDGAYTADRWFWNQAVTASAQVTQGTFTSAELSVPSGITNFYANIAGTITNAATGYIQIAQKIEDVRTLQNTTATVSFYAKGSAAGTINILMRQNFGSGGSAAVLTTPVNFTITTSWARYSTTVSVPSVSGKTIGASSSLELIVVKNMGSNYPTFGTANYTGTLSLWGAQVETGSVATAFQTATGTLQGELAACQRYYYRQTGTGNNTPFALGFASSTTNVRTLLPFPSAMRVAPTSVDFSTLGTYDGGTQTTITAVSLLDSSTTQAQVYATVASGLTANRPYFIQAKDTSAAYLALNAEL